MPRAGGNMAVTREIANAVNGSGYVSDIASVSNMSELVRALETRKFDLVWSALYHVTENEVTVGVAGKSKDWVAGTWTS